MRPAPVPEPQLVVLVMIRRPDPSIAYYGAQVAGPVVGRIIADTLTYLEVPPDDPPRPTGLGDFRNSQLGRYVSTVLVRTRRRRSDDRGLS